MWNKLDSVVARYEELGAQLSSPEVAGNPELLRKYSKEHKELSEVVAEYKQYKKVRSDIVGCKELLETSKDSDMVEMAREELAELEEQEEQLADALRILLLPKDPNDAKNVILEIRAGAGGDEAGIFAGDLFRLYTRYAESLNWKVEAMEVSHATAGGYKEIISTITGDGAYSRFKYESGVHRVQRVPDTETQGRIHTSTVTVAVLPEAEDVEVQIDNKELRVDIFRASGPGGQSVNTTDSAVRITHLPTGIVVSMQDEKSQHKNREKAMRILKARLLDQKQAEADAERSAERRSQVGRGDRSEKIRTYNYPQSRITDHRIGLTLHSLDAVMNGDLDQVLNPLIAHDQAEALKGQNEDG
jgi:peptide chain release factor 1